jgi:hypothetical protein
MMRSMSSGNFGVATDTERNSFIHRLTNANRVLVTLDGIEKPEKSLQIVIAVHEGVLVYCNLLAWRRTANLSDEDADRLQFVMERLRTKLRYFGQDV